ncbi:unnamed protein product [Lasius platythorax]|uniref:Uncharacterized protein n=1 Tax=Lasius platythorax TaxID=488582 RepID=A0AAV2NC83_9HYME
MSAPTTWSPPVRVCACVRPRDCVRVTSGILVSEYSSRGVSERDQGDASWVMFTGPKEESANADVVEEN